MSNVGIIIPDGTNQFFSSVAQNFQKKFAKSQTIVVVADSNNSKAQELINIQYLSDIQVSGLIFISVGDSSQAFDALRKLKMPLLILDREIPMVNADFLINRDKMGIRFGVEYLNSLNHKRIAFIKGCDETAPGRDRFQGFKEVMAELDLELDEQLIFDGDFRFGSGNLVAEEIVSLPEDQRPTAIFTSNDLMALGVLQRLQERGFSVPDDFSLLGFDDINLSSWIHPKLSTIRQDVRQIANVGVELLRKRMRQKIAKGRIRLISPELIKRNSCKHL